MAEIVGGGTPDTGNPNFWDGEIDWYSPAELGERVYADGSVRRITEKGFANCSAKMLPAGRTILFTSRAGIGNTAILRRSACTNQGFQSIVIKDGVNVYFLYSMSGSIKRGAEEKASGSTFLEISGKQLSTIDIAVPQAPEQRKIGALFSRLDDLIALHQRKLDAYRGVSPSSERRKRMAAHTLPTDLFCNYYRDWIVTYKEGAIRKVTMDKYLLTAAWIDRLVPDLPIKDLTRAAYQQLLNGYAEHHERQTTMDFHHQLKCAILDAVDEGLLERDPTRKAVIKGKPPRAKKPKYLNQFELHKLLDVLHLDHHVNWDWLILLIAKTGLRFSEALAVTPDDFNFSRQVLSVDKTWDYKENGGFLPTKNRSSIRKVQLDWQLIIQFAELIKGMPPSQPIFVKGKVYNSTVNAVLSRRCNEAGVPIITVHGLRHTHASLLLFAGVSVASVAKRLGHSSMTTTQKVYLHVIQELENQDVDLVMRSLSGLS